MFMRTQTYIFSVITKVIFGGLFKLFWKSMGFFNAKKLAWLENFHKRAYLWPLTLCYWETPWMESLLASRRYIRWMNHFDPFVANAWRVFQWRGAFFPALLDVIPWGINSYTWSISRSILDPWLNISTHFRSLGTSGELNYIENFLCK